MSFLTRQILMLWDCIWWVRFAIVYRNCLKEDITLLQKVFFLKYINWHMVWGIFFYTLYLFVCFKWITYSGYLTPSFIYIIFNQLINVSLNLHFWHTSNIKDQETLSNAVSVSNFKRSICGFVFKEFSIIFKVLIFCKFFCYFWYYQFCLWFWIY